MPLKRFFVLCQKMRVIRAQENLVNWQIINYVNLKQEMQEKILEGLKEEAFPRKPGEKQWWEDVKPGLHLVSE
jgi:hypothetical protein